MTDHGKNIFRHLRDDDPLDFGDYCYIEQERHGCENEMYRHKVVGQVNSNGWVQVPVQTPAAETVQGQVVGCVRAICCGVDESKAFKYRRCDVKVVSRARPIIRAADYETCLSEDDDCGGAACLIGSIIFGLLFGAFIVFCRTGMWFWTQ